MGPSADPNLSMGAGARRAAPAIGAPLLALFLALSPPVLALDPGRRLTQYPLDKWQPEQGLPQNTVLGIAQTPEGYLWCAGEEGVVRFDGVSFSVFNPDNSPAMGSRLIHALCTTEDGTLWFGMTGGGLGSIKDGVVRSYGAADGLTFRSVSALCPGADGAVWVGTYGGGLFKLSPGRSPAFAAAGGAPGGLIVALCPSRSGDVWVATNDGVVGLLNRGGGFSALPANSATPSAGVQAVLEDRSGALWIGTTTAGLTRRDPDGSFVTPAWARGFAGSGISCLLQDREGALWMGSEEGELHRFVNGRLETLGVKDGMPGSPVRALFEDPAGNLWVGTQTAGLLRLRNGRFITVSTDEGLSSDYATGVQEAPGGGLWVATHGGGLDLLRDGTVRSYRKADGLSSDQIWSLLQAADGTLWIGSDGGGLCRLRNGTIHRFGSREGFRATIVDSLLEDRDGTVWVGTNGDGAYRVRREGLDHFGRPEGLASPVVHVMLADPDGSVWLGTEEGLARFEQGGFTTLTTGDGLSSNLVIALHRDPDGVLWVGTAGGGLSIVRAGTIRTVSRAQGLFDATIMQILPDGLGNLWMSSNQGLFRASRRELLDVAEGRASRVRCVAYGRSDGMKSAECNGGFTPAGIRLRDGRFCFPTVRGIVFVDPAAEAVVEIPPKVLVEQVSWAGTSVRRAASVALPLGVRQFEIRFTGLSHYAPERMVFRYRLGGFDRDWVEVGRRRVAYYTNLHPGRYVFDVVAAGGDGTWSPQGDRLELVVPAYAYETRAFLLAVLAVLLALAALAYRTSVRGLRRRQRRLEAEVERRTSELKDANSALEDRTRELESLNLELERLSTVDALTGLSNRRHFDARLDQEWRRAERTGTPVALVSLDVDYFKEFNDEYGHPAGDACLQELGAHLARSFTRAGDLPARLGGDEFCVILADTPLEEAVRHAENLRSTFEGFAIAHEASKAARVATLSLGVAGGVPDPGATADGFLRAADTALYLAKAMGRNRVCAAPPDAGSPRPATGPAPAREPDRDE